MDIKTQEAVILQQLSATEIGKIKTIGYHKYRFLKTLKFLSDEEKIQVEEYEKRFTSQEAVEKNNKYLQELLVPVEKKEFSITAKELWVLFKSHFQTVNNEPFQVSQVTIKNLGPILYYFAKDERFFKCENLKKEFSKPSFDKGLLIIGNFGNGKTSTMKAFESVFRAIKGGKGVEFSGYSTKQVVRMFENCKGDKADILRQEFDQKMLCGIRYFDDLKSERIASNFGKVNVFEEIIEERYNLKSKTYVTCNFHKDFPNDLGAALDEFEDKYGGRVYDRLFEMFNIIEFEGKSFRE